MQDKNNLNDEFTDFAWSKMSTLLDQEMPVKKKKRRGIVLWLMLGLLMGIGSSAYYFGTTTKKVDADSKGVSPTVEVAPLATKEIPMTPSHSANETEETKESTELVARKEIKSPPNANVQTTKIVTTPVKTSAKVTTTNLQNTIESKVTIPMESISLSSKTILPEKIEKPVLQTVEIKPAVSLLEGLSRVNSTEDIVAIKRLALNPLSFVQIVGLVPPIFENTNSTLKDKPTLIGGSIYGGFQHNNRSSAIGGRLGVDLIFQLRPKMTMTVGLAYQRLKNNYALSIAKVEDDNFSLSSEAYRSFFDSGLNEYYNQDPLSVEESREKIFLPMEYFDFVSLPIQFLFQANPKWQFSAGIDLSYLIAMRGRRLYHQVGVESELQIDGQGSPNIFSGGTRSSELQEQLDELDGTSLLNQINEEDLAFRKWSFGTSIGLSYSPIPSLGIDLRYHFGLSNMVKDELFGAGFYNRSLSLAAAYKF
ncbi:MAG: hypothetical protein AB8G15_22750 [Saprospiraceae bacterium]